MSIFKKSSKLDGVCYDIRGPILTEAKRLEEEGCRIYKLNTGNPAYFNLNTSDEIIHDVKLNLPNAQGYCDSNGIFPARKAVMQYYQIKGVSGLDINDIFIGNGASELILMSMNALLNDGDEILVPMPDYPLWTAAVKLSGGTPVHYLCDEAQSWYPDLEDIKKKVSARTKGIVVINPNNPTGAVYPVEILRQIIQLAKEKNLIVFADEIYDKIVYDETKHFSLAALDEDVLCVTFNGLSKSYRVAGFRTGWMVITGKKEKARDYIEGLNLLSSMRLCSNVPTQYAIQTALGGYQSIDDLVRPGGRLYEQRALSYDLLTSIPGITCVKPKGALYLFPKIDVKKFRIKNDAKFVLDFLISQKVLMVQGTGFNWPEPDHFRVVFLPNVEDLKLILGRLKDFLEDYKQEEQPLVME
ncbi:MAG: pyridoxal phosphate-dependent aminotransferase [Candidatus Firestonebacteria bacterium]|nr:pyridoxal phosphate-dependent aminotransferase [Candidatus Firestonebacteria bacterium]